jgi:hypothetical protein
MVHVGYPFQLVGLPQQIYVCKIMLQPALLLAFGLSVVGFQIPFVPQSHSQGYKFDPLLHLPGISPYFDAIGSGYLSIRQVILNQPTLMIMQPISCPTTQL